MVMQQKLIQAFRQAPWRLQVQKIGLILSGLVVFVLIAGVYLSITAETTTSGLHAQRLEFQKANLQREIADMHTQQALASSMAAMETRAKELGFEKADPANTLYVVVPGYTGRQLRLVSSAPITPVKQVIIKPEYKESLWEFFFETVMLLNSTGGSFAQ